jgi:import inner membrane translocase subunit TIM22
MAEEMTARQQIVYTAKQMGRRSLSNAKTFAVMGLIFSAAECVVEKVYSCNFFTFIVSTCSLPIQILTFCILMLWQARAKHDTTNTAVAGCVTGGALAVKGNYFAISHI